MISIIAAVAENNALGKNNDLMWHLPNDFKRFKEITSGHHIIMGRKTFESFPKPLPNRTHVIITRQENYVHEGCIVVHDLQQAIAACPDDKPVFIIGGGEIYTQSILMADELDITRVHSTFEADVYFPVIDTQIWYQVSEVFQTKDEKHQYDYSFQKYVRKK
jgi:dihydrofolate reductase